MWTTSTSPSRKNDQAMVPPPSTRSLSIPRSLRMRSNLGRSTNLEPHLKTSACGNSFVHSSAVTMRVPAVPSRTNEPGGSRPLESRTTRRGSFPSGTKPLLTLSLGSSAITVSTPTRTAWHSLLNWWTRAKSSSEESLRGFFPRSAILPSIEDAMLRITKGRPFTRGDGR